MCLGTHASSHQASTQCRVLQTPCATEFLIKHLCLQAGSWYSGEMQSKRGNALTMSARTARFHCQKAALRSRMAHSCAGEQSPVLLRGLMLHKRPPQESSRSSDLVPMMAACQQIECAERGICLSRYHGWRFGPNGKPTYIPQACAGLATNAWECAQAWIPSDVRHMLSACGPLLLRRSLQINATDKEAAANACLSPRACAKVHPTQVETLTPCASLTHGTGCHFCAHPGMPLATAQLRV